MLPLNSAVPLVLRQMRGNGLADDDPFELRDDAFVGHEDLQGPTRLADGLEVEVLYRIARAARHECRAAKAERIRP